MRRTFQIRVRWVYCVIGLASLLAIVVLTLNALDSRKSRILISKYLIADLTEVDFVNTLDTPGTDPELVGKMLKSLARRRSLSVLTTMRLIDCAVSNQYGLDNSLEMLRLIKLSDTDHYLARKIKELLRASDPRIKVAAISVLMPFPEYDLELQASFRSIVDENWGLIFAAQEIGKTGTRAKKLAICFFEMLDLKDASIKCVAMDQLVAIGADEELVRTRLTQIINDESNAISVRMHAENRIAELDERKQEIQMP